MTRCFDKALSLLGLWSCWDKDTSLTKSLKVPLLLITHHFCAVCQTIIEQCLGSNLTVQPFKPWSRPEVERWRSQKITLHPLLILDLESCLSVFLSSQSSSLYISSHSPFDQTLFIATSWKIDCSLSEVSRDRLILRGRRPIGNLKLSEWWLASEDGVSWT